MSLLSQCHWVSHAVGEGSSLYMYESPCLRRFLAPVGGVSLCVNPSDICGVWDSFGSFLRAQLHGQCHLKRPMNTVREEAARDAVEVIEVAKASLDHGEQMLTIARKKALRLASIEGCKLLRQFPACLRLVVVWVSDEMYLDTLLVAAHWHTHGQSLP